MSDGPAGGRSVEAVLDLLKDPEFCADAERTIAAAAAIALKAPKSREGKSQLEDLGLAFFERWGVPPPTTGELLDSDPRRRLVDGIASGRWGIVPVFPWTTNRRIQAGIKKIRSVIRKQHQDALVTRHAQFLTWLEVIGFDRPRIARVVFGRRTGLSRPTAAQAITRTSMRRECQLYEEYRGLGLTYNQIEQKIYRRLRGPEAPASAAVRMTMQRYERRLVRLQQNLAVPLQAEPMSHALAMLFRALPDADDTTLRHLATAARNAFVGASGSPRTAAQRREAPSHPALDAVVSGHWGVVPVFPWTTVSDLRASVTKLRTMMRPQVPELTDPPPATRPIPFEPLSDALISLFRAVADQEDGMVRRRALEARVAFLGQGRS